MAILDKPISPLNHFAYSQTGYITWLKEFGSKVGGAVVNNTLSFSPAGGIGVSTAYQLEKGLTACVNNFRLGEDYLFTRHPTSQYGIIIYLYHFQTEAPVKFSLDNILVNLDNGNHYTLRIVNSQTSQHLAFHKTTTIRGISIYLENEWIEQNLSHHLMKVVKYLQQVNYFKQLVNAKQQMLVNEILNVPADHPFPAVYVKSRILRIFDKLLENLLLHDISELPERINEEDFNTLQKIEGILTTCYDQAFPGIEKLSRISLMSESKLKKLFKLSFGMGLYEYYQKNRMHRAKEHIMSGKYSITEVGTRLGYLNLSNFSSAFKKEFNCLPSEITSV